MLPDVAREHQVLTWNPPEFREASCDFITKQQLELYHSLNPLFHESVVGALHALSIRLSSTRVAYHDAPALQAA